MRDIGDDEIRRAATLHLGGPLIQKWYIEGHANRGATWSFDSGIDLHELRAPVSRTFVK